MSLVFPRLLVYSPTDLLAPINLSEPTPLLLTTQCPSGRLPRWSEGSFDASLPPFLVSAELFLPFASHRQSDAMDPFGWTAASLEWLATYLLLWPADGRMKKDQILGVYDVSPSVSPSRSRRAFAGRADSFSHCSLLSGIRVLQDR